jgi:predicted dehydrogenase
MYGIRRTIIKVLGQLHMAKMYQHLPPCKNRVNNRQVVGLIGCGNYCFCNIAFYLHQRAGKVMAACMDINIHRAASLREHYQIPLYTADAGEVTGNEHVQLVYIASNHASHAEYAIDCLEQGKNVYIEKPHAVSEEQLIRLVKVMENARGKVFLGFNRIQSRFGKIIKQYLDQQPGPGLYHWFIVSHAKLSGHWYENPGEGGRVMGNLCHWIDFILYLVSEHNYPVQIIPVVNSPKSGNIIVAYLFKDGTVANLSFSTKNEPFEGVKESFTAHKGDCLITMSDFKTMTIEVMDIKKRFFNFWRDHGHKANIVSAYENVVNGLPYDREQQLSYIWNTGWLSLKTKEALEKGVEQTVLPFAEEYHHYLERN